MVSVRRIKGDLASASLRAAFIPEFENSGFSGKGYKLSVDILLILLLILSSFGCYKTVSVKEVNPEGMTSIKPSEALIFGRMRMIDNGKEKKNYLSMTDQLDIMLVRIEDEQERAVRCVWPDGTYLWKAPRGTYLLTVLRWWEFRGWFPIRPQIVFQVGQDAQAYYLGTLRIDAEIERTELNVKLTRFSVAVVDEYGQDASFLTKQLPNFQGQVDKALMVHDARIPAVTGSEIKQSTFISILHSLGLGLMMVN